MERLICYAFALFCAAVSAQDREYYYVDDEKVYLTSSTKSVVFNVSGPPRLAHEVQLLLKKSQGRLVQANFPQLERANFIVVRARPDLPPAEAVKEIEKIRDAENSAAPIAPTFVTEGSNGAENFLTDRFSVEFTSSVDDAEATRFLEKTLGVSEHRKDKRRPRIYRVSIKGTKPIEALRRINSWHNRPPVRRAWPNFGKIYPDRNLTAGPAAARTGLSSLIGVTNCGPEESDGGDPDDTYFPNQWSLKNTGSNPPPGGGLVGADIGVTDAWQVTEGSPSIKIAVIDTGVDITHPDLRDRSPTELTTANSGNPGVQTGESSHGTAIAGLAAADTGNGRGIAGVDRRASILSVRLGFEGTDGWTTLPGFEQEAEAIDTAVEAGANVLINAWNDYGGAAPGQDLNNAIRDALRAERTVIFSAGNHKNSDCTLGNSSCFRAVRYPGTLVSTDNSPDEVVAKGLIVVSATNWKDQFQTTPNVAVITPSENTGIDFWGSSYGPEISLAAPGTALYVTAIPRQFDQPEDEPDDNGYACMSGTSASTALVGGAAALLLSLHPYATPEQIKTWLQDGADDPPTSYAGTPNLEHFFGHGRLNIAGALAEAAVTLNLEIVRPEDPLEAGARRVLVLKATRNNQPVAGVPIALRSDTFFSWQSVVVTPGNIVTDANGKATALVKLGRLPARTAMITAKGGGGVATVKIELAGLIRGTLEWWRGLFGDT